MVYYIAMIHRAYYNFYILNLQERVMLSNDFTFTYDFSSEYTLRKVHQCNFWISY